MILSGDHAPLGPVACAGLLLIGDPHVSSRRPGRRRDVDWPGAVLAKLAHCVTVANARDLAPVLLGDLFERPVEPDEGLKARLVRLLTAFRHRPLANVGNHDAAHTRLADGDSLGLLALAGVLDVVAISGPAAIYAIGGRQIGLGATPYGQPIPHDVRGLFRTDRVVWLAHHDIAFEAAYPGAVPPHAIAGCDLVVNGHVHRLQPVVTAGGTRWFNPGNITRGSLDLAEHVPAAWVLDGDLALVREPLPHARDVFDLTGRLVQPAAPALDPVESAFVSLLRAESTTDLARSDDGTLLAETIAEKFAREETPDSVRAALSTLLAEAVARRGAG